MNGYGWKTTRALKSAQAIAHNDASLAVTPQEGQSMADYDQEWQAFFDNRMRQMGWEYTGDHCMCTNPDHGHEPACGWTQRSAA